MNTIKANDPLGYIDDVRQAVNSPILKSLFLSQSCLPRENASALEGNIETDWPRAEHLTIGFPELRNDAAKLVSSVGFCRLYGIEVPHEYSLLIDQSWPREILVVAVDEAIRLLQFATKNASTLPQDFDEAEALEDRDYCTSMLFFMMKAWAMFVAIDEQYQFHLSTANDLSSHFSKLMDDLFTAQDAFDAEIQKEEQMSLLSVATELPLLDNWRNMLAKPYLELLPWWLDGTLEEIAEKTKELIDEEFESIPWRFDGSLEDAAETTRKQNTDDNSFPSLTTYSTQSQAKILLANRIQENLSAETRYFLAANAGEQLSPAATKLRQTTFGIVDDLSVKVRLRLDPASNGQWKLVVSLVGQRTERMKYESLKITFSSGDCKDSSFQFGWTETMLQKEEVDDIQSLVLSDQTGIHRRVEL